MKKTILMLLCCLLLFAACGSKEEPAPDIPAQPAAEAPAEKPAIQNPKSTEPLPVQEAAKEQPAPEPPKPVTYPSPLSGLPLETDVSAQRPIAVMINNHKDAQPTLSLSRADIIYEYIAEGGITRLLALYQNVEGIEQIGTVRSARPYYLETALAYDAIYVHAGGSDEAYAELNEWKMDHMDGVKGGRDASIFWRDSWRRKNNGYEHSLLTSGEKINAYVKESGMRSTHAEGFSNGLCFGETSAAAEGAKAEKLSVKFSAYKTGVFAYDAESGLYNVSQYGAVMTDGTDGPGVAVKNVLVLHTKSKVLDDAGRMRFSTTGTGSGSYYCEGRRIDIVWSRNDRNSAYLYAKADGTALTLMPGSSYICVIDRDCSQETSE